MKILVHIFLFSSIALFGCEGENKSDKKEEKKPAEEVKQEIPQQEDTRDPEVIVRELLANYYQWMSNHDKEKIASILSDHCNYLMLKPYTKERALKHIDEYIENTEKGWYELTEIKSLIEEEGVFKVKTLEKMDIAFPAPAMGYFEIGKENGSYKILVVKDISEEIESNE
ncbi:MAG: hypothetical protein KDC84_06310 [Crocinitomicaceae bacterium]|nr:hypothetical protein [Crocinitomicaceae bacterium]